MALSVFVRRLPVVASDASQLLADAVHWLGDAVHQVEADPLASAGTQILDAAAGSESVARVAKE